MDIAAAWALVAKELVSGEKTGGWAAVEWKWSAVFWSGTVIVRRIGIITCTHVNQLEQDFQKSVLHYVHTRLHTTVVHTAVIHMTHSLGSYRLDTVAALDIVPVPTAPKKLHLVDLENQTRRTDI